MPCTPRLGRGLDEVVEEGIAISPFESCLLGDRTWAVVIFYRNFVLFLSQPTTHTYTLTSLGCCGLVGFEWDHILSHLHRSRTRKGHMFVVLGLSNQCHNRKSYFFALFRWRSSGYQFCQTMEQWKVCYAYHPMWTEMLGLEKWWYTNCTMCYCCCVKCGCWWEISSGFHCSYNRSTYWICFYRWFNFNLHHLPQFHFV